MRTLFLTFLPNGETWLSNYSPEALRQDGTCLIEYPNQGYKSYCYWNASKNEWEYYPLEDLPGPMKLFQLIYPIDPADHAKAADRLGDPVRIANWR